ncbi:hypothetical protein CLIB1423_18S00518 [[Candida] railenensis]|uniref:Uncharacterized protein n=1 Tax=[Candida] railenensis TaxID=45579 RepID=A0A9P0VZ89_9ASCO|nr:hypothetical protein CLIB1423_18S00518 [[Candida] railenensis]
MGTVSTGMSIVKYSNFTETVTEIITKTIYVPVYHSVTYSTEHFPTEFNSSIPVSTKDLAEFLSEGQTERYWYPANTAEPEFAYGLDGILHLGHHAISTTQEKCGEQSITTGHHSTVTGGSEDGREEIKVEELLQQDSEGESGEVDEAHFWPQVGQEKLEGLSEVGWPVGGADEQDEVDVEQKELEQNKTEETLHGHTSWVLENGQKKDPPTPAESAEEQEKVPAATATQLNDIFLATPAPASNNIHSNGTELSESVHVTEPNTQSPMSEHFSLRGAPRITRKTFNGVVAHNWSYASTFKGESPQLRYLPVYTTLFFTIAAIPLLL